MMRVLIVENEIYLAQSIALKLSEVGFECEIIASVNELAKEREYEVVLLSAAVNDFNKIIEKFKHQIIILLVSYISTDTVLNPLKMGVCDYMQKPLILEELLRKIKHYQDFRKLSSLNKAYKTYIQMRLKSVALPEINFKKLKFPMIIRTSKQSVADAFVFKYINDCDLELSYFSLSSTSSYEKIFKEIINKNNLLYLSNFDVLKQNEKEKILDFVQNKKAILHSSMALANVSLPELDLSDNAKNIESSDILTLDEYIKYVISSYQNIFPDTDLAKKLGISRKSLWEKRKKYEIIKKK